MIICKSRRRSRCAASVLLVVLTALAGLNSVVFAFNEDVVPLCSVDSDEIRPPGSRERSSLKSRTQDELVDVATWTSDVYKNVTFEHIVQVGSTDEFIDALYNIENSTWIKMETGEYGLPGPERAPAAFWLQDLHNVMIEGKCQKVDGYGNCVRSETTLSCENEGLSGTGLAFLNSVGIVFANVTIHRCGAVHWSTSWSNMTGQLPIMSALVFARCQNVTLYGTTIELSRGAGAFLVDVSGHVHVESCTFRHNNATDMLQYLNYADNVTNTTFGGGGLLVEFAFCKLPILFNASDITNSTFYPLCEHEQHGAWIQQQPRPRYLIYNNTFQENRGLSYNILKFTFIRPGGHFHQAFGRGGGLSMFFKGFVHKSDILVDSCNFFGNEGAWGGGLFMELQDGVSHTNITIQSCRIEGNIGHEAGGGVRIGFIFLDENITQEFNSIQFTGVDIVSNEGSWGGGLSAYTATEPRRLATNQLRFNGCSWWKNVAQNAAAVALSRWHYVTLGAVVEPVFAACTFRDNVVRTSLIIGRGTILVDMLALTLVDSSLCGNNGSALVLDTSSVNMRGSITFHNNTGDTGGAVMLTGFSWITLNSDTSVAFLRNMAHMYGGAVYCQTNSAHSVLSSRNCFLQYADPMASPDQWNATVTFSSNAAHAAGHSIYATTLFHCLWGGDIEGLYPRPEQMKKVMNWTNFHYYPKNRAGYEIATSANRLVPPAGRVQMAPGEHKAINVRARDDLDQLSDTVVYITVDASAHNEDNVTVGEDSYRTITDDSMSSIWLVGEPLQNRTLRLRTLSAIPVDSVMTVETTQCHPCYWYSPAKGKCVCVTDTKQVSHTAVSRCDDSNYGCYLQNGYWGGFINNQPHSPGDSKDLQHSWNTRTFVTLPCPFDYCHCDSSSNAAYSECALINNATEDTEDKYGFYMNAQCMNGRVGRLCGSCREGLSVLLGSNECRNCTSENAYIVWGSFSIIGIFITVFMIWTDFNILSGHVNSPWFYFQVLPYIMSDNASYHFNTIPPFNYIMNLVNASLPWATCFIGGLGDLEKLAISYAVPTYILLIVLAVAVVCRYPRMKRLLLCGYRKDQEPSVLKTLCSLLAVFYVSLVGNSFQLLMFVDIGDSGPWLYRDANVKFWGREHAPWGVLAVLIIILVAIPLPLFLLCGPRLQRRYSLTRFKPLLDIVQEPYAPNRRSFAGFYFMARLVFLALTTTEIIPLNIRQAVLQLLCLLVLVIHMCAQPYGGRFIWLNWVDTVVLATLAATVQVNFFYGIRSDSGETTEWAAYVVITLMSIPLLYLLVFIVTWVSLTVLHGLSKRGLVKRRFPKFRYIEQAMASALVALNPQPPRQLETSYDSNAASILWTASSTGTSRSRSGPTQRHQQPRQQPYYEAPKQPLLQPVSDNEEDDDDDTGHGNRSYSTFINHDAVRERNTNSSRGYESSSTINSVASQHQIGDEASGDSVRPNPGDSGHG
ncbi:uncharacterized protein LOC135811564 [Sycon ciliatum]|uniref:uncharacterized protein LOC135811564 n=1 Tax=Sycon ciliatum TaxID=27933 RepID=UPI0031F64A09